MLCSAGSVARPLYFVALGLALLAAGASAGESRIELADGSVLTGELVGVGGGTYRIRTAALGEIAVKEDDVLAIRPVGVAPTSAPAGGPAGTGDPAGAASAGQGYGAELAAIQRQLAGDASVMASITALQNDPQIKSVLADPDFVRRVLAGDVQGLQDDPRFQEILNHPAVRAIVEQVGAR